MKTSNILLLGGLAVAGFFALRGQGVQAFSGGGSGFPMYSREQAQAEIDTQKGYFTTQTQAAFQSQNEAAVPIAEQSVILQNKNTGAQIGQFTSSQIQELLSNRAVSSGGSTYKIEDFHDTKAEVQSQMKALGWEGSEVYKMFSEAELRENPRSELVQVTSSGGSSRRSSSPAPDFDAKSYGDAIREKQRKARR